MQGILPVVVVGGPLIGAVGCTALAYKFARSLWISRRRLTAAQRESKLTGFVSLCITATVLWVITAFLLLEQPWTP